MALDRLQAFLGEASRPFAIIITGLSVAVTPLVIAIRMAPDKLDLIGAAALMAALYGGHVGLYASRSWENSKASAQAASVEIAKASQPPERSAP